MKNEMIVQNALKALAMLEEAIGVEPGKLQTAIMDLATLTTRLEKWDMIMPFIDGVDLPEPTVGEVTGLDTGLFYRKSINMVWGDDGQGKSLLIDQVTWVERGRGHKVMILESEELTPDTRVARWLDESNNRQLVTVEDVAGVIVYPVHRPLSPDNVGMFATQIRNEDVSVVFVDSLGAMMANMGLDENKASDVYKVKTEIFDPLAEAGAAVVVVDHVTKSEGDKTKSIGSTRKRSILSGAGYELKVPDGGGFSRRKSGMAELRCWKDRHGRYNRGELIAFMWVAPASLAGYLQIGIEVPAELLGDEEQRVVVERKTTDEQLVDRMEVAILEAPMIGWAALKMYLGVSSQDEVKRIATLAATEGRFYRNKASRWIAIQQKVTE